jgi:membrane protein
MSVPSLKSVWLAFNEDKCPRLAAAIAYSTIFSIAPLLIILIAILGWFVGVQNGGHGHHVAENALLDQVRKSVGAGSADTVRQLISASFNKPRQSIVAQVLGWVAFIVGAAALFSSLQDALNAVWGVESAKGGWKLMLRDRLSAFSMLLAVGFLLIVSFLATAAVAFIGAHFLSRVPLVGNPVVLGVIDQIVTFGIVTVVFALIFKVLPDVEIAWRDTWIGALATAVLFVIGQALISWYLAVAGVASAYGAAGSLLVTLLWIYYSAMILLLGAEFTKLSARDAKTVVPSKVRELRDRPAGVDPRPSPTTS